MKFRCVDIERIFLVGTMSLRHAWEDAKGYFRDLEAFQTEEDLSNENVEILWKSMIFRILFFSPFLIDFISIHFLQDFPSDETLGGLRVPKKASHPIVYVPFQSLGCFAPSRDPLEQRCVGAPAALAGGVAGWGAPEAQPLCFSWND